MGISSNVFFSKPEDSSDLKPDIMFQNTSFGRNSPTCSQKSVTESKLFCTFLSSEEWPCHSTDIKIWCQQHKKENGSWLTQVTVDSSCEVTWPANLKASLPVASTRRNEIRDGGSEDQKQGQAAIFAWSILHFGSCHPLWPSSLRMTPCHYRTQPCFQSQDSFLIS